MASLTQPKLRSLRLNALALLVLTLAGLATLWVAPPDVASQWPSLCPIKLVLGYTCPGCGMGRALFCFAHGQWAAGHAANGLAWLALPVLGCKWLMLLWRAARLAV
jgi:hypothetical protein